MFRFPKSKVSISEGVEKYLGPQLDLFCGGYLSGDFVSAYYSA